MKLTTKLGNSEAANEELFRDLAKMIHLDDVVGKVEQALKDNNPFGLQVDLK